jgi:hypothetical protein
VGKCSCKDCGNDLGSASAPTIFGTVELSNSKKNCQKTVGISLAHRATLESEWANQIVPMVAAAYNTGDMAKRKAAPHAEI